MTHDELRERAALVAALPEGDPDRAEFLAHAKGCAECAQALREGEKLQAMLGRVSLPPPTPEALSRAREAVLAEMKPSWLLQAAAAIPGFFVPLLIARHLDAAGWTFALLTLAVATLLAASAGALRAGAVVVLAASAGFALAAGGVPGMPQAKDFATGELMCPLLELIAAALPLAAAAWLYRKNPRPGALAQAAAAGALAGQAALDLACPGAHLAEHLWPFHVGGVLVALLLGYALEGGLRSARISSAASSGGQ